MNKTQNDKYNEVKLSQDMCNMLCDLIMADETMEQVYDLILNHTYFEKRNSEAYGISKKEIQSKITVKSSKRVACSTNDSKEVKNKFIPAETQLSKKSCDNIINFLSGTTLIYYTEGNSRKYYQLTQRGIIVAGNLRQKGSLVYLKTDI